MLKLHAIKNIIKKTCAIIQKTSGVYTY